MSEAISCSQAKRELLPSVLPAVKGLSWETEGYSKCPFGLSPLPSQTGFTEIVLIHGSLLSSITLNRTPDRL